MEADTIYFARRAQQEKAAAKKAQCREARQAHLDIAARYDELVQAIGMHESVPASRRPRLELVSQLQG